MNVEMPPAASQSPLTPLVDALSSTAVATLYSEHEADLVVVAQKETVAEGVVALTLADPNGQELPAWPPGAHINLVLTDPPLTRQYSLCSNPADRHAWRIGVLRNVLLSYGSANRDETQFEQPETYNLDRPPRQHLAFGRAYTSAPGASSRPRSPGSRYEELLGTLPSIELDPAHEVVVWGWFFRGPRALHVTWSTR